MEAMFAQCKTFNQNIGGWNVSNVTNMRAMFSDAGSFIQDIGNWDVSNITPISFMFRGGNNDMIEKYGENGEYF
jgi:surface protein